MKHYEKQNKQETFQNETGQVKGFLDVAQTYRI